MKVSSLQQKLADGITNNTQSCVLTIGNFDGLHLGHQSMLKQTVTLAQQKGLATCVMVFEPMPKEYFAPQKSPARLTNLAETKQVFTDFNYQGKGIDELIVVDFNEDFRSLSAAEFAEMLASQLNVKAVVLGDDFRFGHDRTGDSAFLANYCADASSNSCDSRHNSEFETDDEPKATKKPVFEVVALNTVTDHQAKDQRISSTRIRELLAEGNLAEANQLLGRDYFIIGEVMHGDKIGRTLDFPTANVALDRLKPALHGVYAVDVQLIDKEGNVVENGWRELAIDGQMGVAGLAKDALFGTANVGTRPAVSGLVDELEWRLEIHFPKFKGNLYGQLFKVRFLHYLHGERNYDGLQALKSGIQQDVAELIAWREAQ